MKVLSFGGGVQTVTMAVMSCGGDLPMPDVAIFADPQWETQSTYDYIAGFEVFMKFHGLKFVKASRGNIRANALDGKRWASMPLYTVNEDGKKGMLRRQCTNDFKVQVVYKEVRNQLGMKRFQRVKGKHEMWLGISIDEATRMKDSRVKWCVNKYPLIEKEMSRQDCLNYLRKHGITIPPKSACIGCPFHSDDYWRALKKNSPMEFEDACQFDEAIRNSTRRGIKSPVFIHAQRKPLRDIKFEHGQKEAFQNECEGHCGL